MKKSDKTYKTRLISRDKFNEFCEKTFDNKHFRYDVIRKFGARWNLLFSGRNDGKSTAVLSDEALRHYMTDGKRLVYIRRRRDEAKIYQVQKYFREKCFLKMLNLYVETVYPEYTDPYIEPHKGELKLYGLKDDTYTQLDILGYYTALEDFEMRKSGGYENVGVFIYEEFLATSRPELEDEFEKLLNAISTYSRDDDFTAILVGNTVKRRSSIFEGFGVNPDNIPLGIVQTFEYTDEKNNKNTLAVLHIKETESRKESTTNFYFGERKKTNLIGDEWYISDYPPIPEEYKYNSFRSKISLILITGQIKLFLYLIDEKTLLCSNERMSDCEYITLCDKTDLNKKWLSIAANHNFIKILKIYVAHNFVRYNCNNAGDDLRIFLESQK